ncbi:MAG: PSD1 and planctomycete cytochrome C domain-containing protein, partial [Planctomycetaceae bacterium]
DADPVSAERVAPILASHCSACHNEKDPERDLNLSTHMDTLRGSRTGPVVTPGKASASLLMQVLAPDANPHMPPEDQLTREQISTIASWIDGIDRRTLVGRRKISEADRQHWSFQRVARPSLPVVKHRSWPRTGIDRFVLAKLEAAHVEPSPPAEKEVLLRRLYFDLVGLPPSPEEVEAFLKADSEEAYQRVVDRLLASPRYGERWGRHWLDLARYADSGGFHNDIDRPFAWRYRDYVIQSLNADKPYARFIREQIAGDELPHATLETWTATGFCRNGVSNDDNMGKTALARLKHRMDQMDDVISTTANVFLGLTIGCARCHDHKHDPILQQDYYAFLAFFNSSQRQELLLKNFRPERPNLKPVKAKTGTKNPFVMVFTDHGQKPAATHLLWRGNVENKGPLVTALIPLVLRPVAASDASLTAHEDPTGAGSHRLQLANWIASDDNPLTWRVMANRLWHYHFSRGLVTTPSNLGRLGDHPTHPNLLDWLACELRDNGGRLKAMHRLIVTSAVYRQSSQATARGSAVDPHNRLWWRMDKRRLEAEPLRDA